MSTRTKETIKTGLAMAIAYGIALQMDWDRPYWASFAVAFISLPTTDQSLHKGALRMLGPLGLLAPFAHLVRTMRIPAVLRVSDNWGYKVRIINSRP